MKKDALKQVKFITYKDIFQGGGDYRGIGGFKIWAVFGCRLFFDMGCFSDMGCFGKK
jgi:hypothetical protein